MYKFEDRGHVKRYYNAERLQKIADTQGGYIRSTAACGIARR